MAVFVVLYNCLSGNFDGAEITLADKVRIYSESPRAVSIIDG